MNEPEAWKYRLSLDQMIGIFCLCFLFVASGFNLHLAMWIGGIFAIVYAWRALHRVAPVTAMIIAAFFALLFAAILGGGRGGYRGYRRRRWW